MLAYRFAAVKREYGRLFCITLLVCTALKKAEYNDKPNGIRVDAHIGQAAFSDIFTQLNESRAVKARLCKCRLVKKERHPTLQQGSLHVVSMQLYKAGRGILEPPLKRNTA